MTDLQTSDLRSQLQGLWLPLVTPFRDGELDEASLRRLVRHYARGPVDGFILAATSGEGLTLEMAELEQVVALVRAGIAESGRTLPVCLGLSGSSTASMLDALDETAAWPIDGYLIASPYYVRPSQRGLLQQRMLVITQQLTQTHPVCALLLPQYSSQAVIAGDQGEHANGRRHERE